MALRAQYNDFSARGRHQEALAVAEALIAREPTIAMTHAVAGQTLVALGRHAEALERLSKARELDPRDAGIATNVGACLACLRRRDEAIAAYRAALSLDRGWRRAAVNLTMELLATAATDEAMTLAKETARRHPTSLEALRNVAVVANYDVRSTHATISLAHRTFGQVALAQGRAIASDPKLPPLAKPASADEPLRIGFFSADFRQHAVARFFVGVLESLDQSAVRPILYHLAPSRDAMTERLAKLADLVDVHALDDGTLVARARRDRLHVAVDLMGLTDGARPVAFAARLAPRQIAWLGYATTCGIPGVDLRVVDGLTDPEGADGFHVERLVRVTAPFVRWRADASVTVGPLSDEERGARPFTFGSFNTVMKLNEPLVRRWAAAVIAVPGARLLLKAEGFSAASARERVLGWLADAGLARERVELRAETASYAEHVATYREVDVALDSFPYHGTTTTVEALSQGVPVVTLVGDRHASRVGLSLLSAVDLRELAATSDAEFVAAATALAHDRPRRDALRRELPGRIATGALGDVGEFADEFVRVLRTP